MLVLHNFTCLIFIYIHFRVCLLFVCSFTFRAFNENLNSKSHNLMSLYTQLRHLKLIPIDNNYKIKVGNFYLSNILYICKINLSPLIFNHTKGNVCMWIKSALRDFAAVKMNYAYYVLYLVACVRFFT